MAFAASLPRAASLSGRAGLGIAILALAMSGSAALATTSVSHRSAEAPAVTTTQTTSHPTAPTTGNSANAFGQSVENYIESTCKPARTAADRGIGDCVSSWVGTHNPSNQNGHKGH